MDRPPHAGLRHLALNVRSLVEMKRFYVDLLGFTIEWEPDPDNVYLSSGIDNLALHRPAEASRSDVADVSRLRGSGEARHSAEGATAARGTYRVVMRHGVSALTSGTRMSLGIIFHDGR